MKKWFVLKFVVFFLISTILIGFITFFFNKYDPSVSFPDAQASTSSLKYTTVVIDAGHGGEDGGASSAAGLVEKNVNLEISKILGDMLRSNGVNVVLTRDDDRLLYDRNIDFKGRKKVLDLAARLNIAETTPNSIFISIHMNAFSDPKYSGLQVWYSPNNEQSYDLAKLIQDNNCSLLQPNNTRKVKCATSSIFLLDRAQSPAVLVECGFLSNVDEAQKFESYDYQKKVAFTVFASVMKFLANAP